MYIHVNYKGNITTVNSHELQEWSFVPAHSTDKIISSVYLIICWRLSPTLSKYSFGLDSKTINKEGVWYAFNQNTEVNFYTDLLPHDGGSLLLCERGCGKQLVWTIKDAVKIMIRDEDNDFLHTTWLEWFIRAAELQVQKYLQSKYIQ